MNKDITYNKEGIGGKDFDPNCEEVTFGKKILKNLKSNEEFTEIATIPGMSFGHSLWRFEVHFKKEFEDLKGFKIIKYDKDKLGQEEAVRVMWLK